MAWEQRHKSEGENKASLTCKIKKTTYLKTRPQTLRRAINRSIRLTTRRTGRSWMGRKSGRSRGRRFLSMRGTETTTPFLGFSLGLSLRPVNPLLVIRVWSQLVRKVFVNRRPAKITLIGHFNYLYPLRNNLSTWVQGSTLSYDFAFKASDASSNLSSTWTAWSSCCCFPFLL